MLSEKKEKKRNIWTKKWYLKRNISCDAHLLNELLETDVPWDDAIVVSAGKLRKLWDSLSELRSSVCERRLGNTVLRSALLPVKTAQFTHFFRQVWRHTVRSLSLAEGVYSVLYIPKVDRGGCFKKLVNFLPECAVPRLRRLLFCLKWRAEMQCGAVVSSFVELSRSSWDTVPIPVAVSMLVLRFRIQLRAKPCICRVLCR